MSVAEAADDRPTDRALEKIQFRSNPIKALEMKEMMGMSGY